MNEVVRSRKAMEAGIRPKRPNEAIEAVRGRWRPNEAMEAGIRPLRQNEAKEVERGCTRPWRSG